MSQAGTWWWVAGIVLVAALVWYMSAGVRTVRRIPPQRPPHADGEQEPKPKE